MAYFCITWSNGSLLGHGDTYDQQARIEMCRLILFEEYFNYLRVFLKKNLKNIKFYFF